MCAVVEKFLELFGSRHHPRIALPRDFSMQCNIAISECKNNARIGLLSACNFDDVNNAILHQFTIFALVLTAGNLLGQTLVLQTLQTTANASCFILVVERFIYIFRCERIRQSTIAQPRLLLMAHVRRLCRRFGRDYGSSMERLRLAPHEITA